MTTTSDQKASLSEDKVCRVALKAFFGIVKKWQLTNEEAIRLLGCPARATYFRWKSELQGSLSKDELERISYILGIYKALRILLPSEEAANAWPRKPNQALLFNGMSALEKMLAGNVVDLADVRRYLDAERGW